MFDFGLRIRELREARKMSQETFGKRIGRSKPVISSYENNIKTPPLDVLIKISNEFNVSLDYLVGKEKTKTLNVNGLSPSQIKLLNLIVDDFRDGNNIFKGLSARQQKILNLLIIEFVHTEHKPS